MDRQDPNTWTPSYASQNLSDCLAFLRETNQLVIRYTEQENYSAAIAGLDRILNGLIVILNSKSMDVRSHISLFSMCEAHLVAFGIDAPESNRKSTAIQLMEDAIDFAKSETTKANFREILNEFRNCTSLADLRDDYGADFQEAVLDMLNNLNKQLYPSSSSGSSSSSSSSSGGGCYVATAVYGSYDCPQVWTLRRFRDNTLAATFFGRMFVRIYYAVSPTLVKWFGRTNWFKKLWRGPLDRLVHKLNRDGVADTAYEDRPW